MFSNLLRAAAHGCGNNNNKLKTTLVMAVGSASSYGLYYQWQQQKKDEEKLNRGVLVGSMDDDIEIVQRNKTSVSTSKILKAAQKDDKIASIHLNLNDNCGCLANLQQRNRTTTTTAILATSMLDEQRESLVYKAKLAEQADRFDEMVSDMKEVAKQPQELTVEERNLLSVAYKNVIGSRRTSWRVATSIEQKGDPAKMTIIKDYKSKIETELVDICNDILSIIEESLLPNSTTEEAKVFYYKMKGDYHRYLSEVQVGDVRKESAGAALDAYQAAASIASSKLPPTHPIRLGLALNFSVLHYEILNSPDKACQIANQAFDDAYAELDTLNEESFKDSTLIMRLLLDNLKLWTSEMIQ